MHINIPADLPFSALALSRSSATGAVSFDTATIAAIERASGLAEGYFMDLAEGAVAELIVSWYSAHRAAGGAADPVAEDLLAEVRAEDASGAGLSHEPGRA